MHRLLPLLALVLSFSAAAQQTQVLKAKRSHIVHPAQAVPGLEPSIIPLEAPRPDGEGVRSYLMQLKQEQRRLHPIKEAPAQKTSTTPAPLVRHGRLMTRIAQGSGMEIALTGGTPNDNTLAVSNNGTVMAAINSSVWSYDANSDSLLFPFGSLSLTTFAQAGGGINVNYFDPKLIYDPMADRFILVFLKNNDPATNLIFICFSSSNNPNDPWYAYTLPGNPLSNNRWTDYPALAISETELFITGNLIIPGMPWQLGFDGSIIWQVNLAQGYANAAEIDSKLWSDIRYNGKFVRNLHPVQDASGNGSEVQYFLSNRNFALSNDTIFLVTLTGTQDNPTATTVVSMGQTDIPYGVPPFARQADTDTTNPASGFDTNDGRVLGAFLNEEGIRFASNSINPTTGLAGIYLGSIENLNSNPSFSGKILGHPTWDLGYPNMAFAGKNPCDRQYVMAFDYTSPTDFAGVAAVFVDEDFETSNFQVLKAGDNYVDKISGGYDRWGDYFGMQRRFSKANEFWTAGFIGLSNRTSGTWISHIAAPDTNHFDFSITGVGGNATCTGRASLTMTGGKSPYTWSAFKNGAMHQQGSGDQASIEGLCQGDTLDIEAMDNRGCVLNQRLVVPLSSSPANGVAYPNPFTDLLALRFSVPVDGPVAVLLTDALGKETLILERNLQAGLHELSLNTASLSVGTYAVRIYLVATEEMLLEEKIIRQ